MRLIGYLVGAVAIVLVLQALGDGPSPVVGGVAGFTVDTNLDDPDVNPGDGQCYTGEIPGCSLRAAVQELNALGGTHTITVPAGTYNINFGAAGEDAAATGDLDLTAQGLTINGAAGGGTIVQRNGGTHRLFDVISGSHTITHVTIQNGLGDGGDGGGIRVNFGATLTLANSTVSGSTAGGVGGGIHTDGTLTVVDSTISGNDATAGTLGGGISVGFSGAATVSGSTISANTAGAFGLGGGIRTRGPLTVTNSTVSGNTASDGGGISNIDPGTLSVISSTIFGNTGSGILVSGTTYLGGTIIANSSGWECNVSGGSMNSLGYNIEGENTCSLNGLGDLVNTDPQLAALANNGGPTMTHAPMPGSPVVDAGSPAPPGGGGSSCPVKDQRHYNRPADGDGDLTVRCDVGAVEGCPAAPDGDADFVGDACDNCPAFPNNTQLDADGDNAGDVCEAAGSGNVDCSDAVNSIDALKVLRKNSALSVAQEEPCQDIGLALAASGLLMGDVDCSGGVNSVDALKIQRAVALLSVAQPQGCPPVKP